MKNLDDLKRETLTHIPEKEHYTAHWIIDRLHAQGRIVPDGYVAVPLEPTEEMRHIGCMAFIKSTTSGHGMLDAYKTMIAAAQKGDE